MLLKTRKEELKSITRYKQNPVCKPMNYTPDLFIHVQRVTWLASEICEKLGLTKKLTQEIIRNAMFHDDSEIIAGDIATPVKQNWSLEEKIAYEKKCKNAIPTLVHNYGKELGNDYEQILLQEEDKKNLNKNKQQDLIHSIIEYIDKLDAYMETFHELYSGNAGFLSNMKETFGKDITCWEYISNRVIRRKNKLEKIFGIKLEKESCFNIKQLLDINITEIVQKGIPHSEDSIKEKTGIEIYDLWKELHFKQGTPEHISYLYTQNITY